jgi:hypothetical protein
MPSLFKKFRLSETKELEFRTESGESVQPRQPPEPNDFLGDPANPNSNAGVINSTAYFEPIRNETSSSL